MGVWVVSVEDRHVTISYANNRTPPRFGGSLCGAAETKNREWAGYGG